MVKKEKNGRSQKVNKTWDIKDEKIIESADKAKLASRGKPKFPISLSTKNIILVVILVLAVLVWRFKGYFFVATVNGQPVSRFELVNQLIRRFGRQTLDSIINERLLIAATRQKGVFITSQEINNQVKQIEEKLKGQMSLSEALKLQGLSEEDFRRQIEIQLAIDKLFGEEASVSGKEIDDYYSTNKEAYKNATNPAQIREEIKGILERQKVGDLFNQWFNDIKSKANIKTFL